MRLVMIAALLLTAVSCSDNKSATATTSSDVSTTSSVAVSTPTSTSPPAPKVCSEPHASVPPGITATAIPDVDGDGHPDQGFFEGLTPTGGRRFVVITAAGGRAEADVQSASPAPAIALVANADERGPVEILVSDNRTVSLFVYVDCTMKAVRNMQSAQYQFDLGFRGTGTGVGCVGLGADRELVGLNVTSDDQTVVKWRRTVIDLNGTSARNGSSSSGTFTRPADAAAIDLLHTVSCGDRTITRDGVHEPPGG